MKASPYPTAPLSNQEPGSPACLRPSQDDITELLDFSSKLILRAFMYSEDNSQWRIQSTWSKLDHTDRGGLQK